MAKAKVAVLRVKPDRILDDIDRLHELAGVEQALDKSAQTILKDNISWHFPFPAANTTPWQLEGCARSLATRGYEDLVCVQNKTVVTDAFKGEDLNGYVPIFEAYDIPVRYNFKPEDMSWSYYQPKARMNVLDKIFPEGILIPDDFHGTNIVHLPTVKCVAGDTEVMLADGSIKTVRALVDGQLARSSMVALERDGTAHTEGTVRVLAMDDQGVVRPFEAVAFSRSRHSSKDVVKLRTRSGRTLVASSEHLLHTPEGWRPAGDLSAGQRVGVARRVRVTGQSQLLPQTHASLAPTPIAGRVGRTYSAAFAQAVIDGYQAGATATALSAQVGVPAQSIQSLLHRHGVEVRRNVAPLSLPAATTPAFWRWMGLVISEGCVEVSANSYKLWWSNGEPNLVDEFVSLTRELFGLEAKRGRDPRKVHISSRRLVSFLEEIGLEVPLNAANKRVPPALFRCPNDEIAAFLAAYLDGDGTVAKKQADLSAVTKSDGLARDLQNLFARLGVVAMRREVARRAQGWTESKPYYLVTVSGAALLDLDGTLELRHERKRARFAAHVARLRESRRPSNWDTVPLPATTFRRVRQGLGFTQQSTGRPSSVNSIENGHGQVTPRVARYFIELFRRADTGGDFSDDLQALASLASEDLAWDHVESVEPVESGIDLYDVTVPGAGCFWASGIIAHNCHIYTTTTGAMKNAFGGLLNTKRHYTHSWIHATLVDLLAIQKEIHAGLFAVMDGCTAGDGPGPRTMRPVIKDVMLASEDQVAIDAVAASMMGFDPMSLEYIRLAHEQGLGKGKREDIEVVGDVAVADERWGFSVGDNGASRVGDIMWFGPLKRFQKLFFHTPLVNVFVAGSEAYHDYYRWPLRDKRVFEQWKADTTWGQLFAWYQQHGSRKLADESEAA